MYEIIFEYLAEDEFGSQTLDRVVMPIVPKRGSDIVIDRSKMSLSINEETGDIKWINRPVAENFPYGSVMIFHMFAQNETGTVWLGYFDCHPYENKKYNIYNCIENINVDDILSGKVSFEIFYKVETIRG